MWTEDTRGAEQRGPAQNQPALEAEQLWALFQRRSRVQPNDIARRTNEPASSYSVASAQKLA